VPPSAVECGLPGRERLLAEVRRLLRRRQDVLLVGPAGVGKTAVIRALARTDVVVIDPFEDITSHRAAAIRRALTRRTLHLAAARSLDRRRLGAVRRIAFWFTVVPVPPLPPRWIARLALTRWRAGPLGVADCPDGWVQGVVCLARGRPGLALEIVRSAELASAERGTVPSPAAAFIAARVRGATERTA
jgi:hypothetical protein